MPSTYKVYFKNTLKGTVSDNSHYGPFEAEHPKSYKDCFFNPHKRYDEHLVPFMWELHPPP